MSYDILVRPDTNQAPSAKVDDVYNLLSSYPVTHVDSHFMVLEEGSVRVEIGLTPQGNAKQPHSSEAIAAIELGVPYRALDDSGPAMFRLAFDIAGKLKWKVYDPQLDREIGKSEVSAALARATRRNRRHFLGNVRISTLTLPVGISAFFLGAVLSAYLVFWVGLHWGSPEDTFFFLTPILGLAFMYLVALLAKLVKRRLATGTGSQTADRDR